MIVTHSWPTPVFTILPFQYILVVCFGDLGAQHIGASMTPSRVKG